MRSAKTVKIAFCVFCFLALVVPFRVEAQTSLRSFDKLFPGIGESQKKEIFSVEGLVRSHEKNEPLVFIPAAGSGIDLHGAVMKTNPSYLSEALLVLPYSGRTLDRLDSYNALQNVSGLKGRLYRSHTRNAEVPLFEDAARLESEKSSAAIPDPPPAAVLPSSETVFMRLKDINFGNSYYRGEMSTSPYGLTYALTNYRNLSYLLFTVMKAERFTAVLYMEPLAEGMLIYSMAGADASNFIASKVDIPSAITKRLAVFIGWISDGLKS